MDNKPRFANFGVTHYVDETVREGSERCLFKVPVEQYLDLIHAMSAAGLRSFVIFSGPDEIDLVLRCAEQKLDHALFPEDTEFHNIWLMNCWERAHENFSKLPSSYVKDLTISFGMIEHREDESLFERVVERARALGAEHFKVSVLNDFRSGFDEEGYERVAHQVGRAKAAGISTVRINDSTGKLFPDEVAVLCRRLVSDFSGLTFCLHAHQDRGLGLANELTALYNGFDMAEGSLAGFGNRAGLPAHEQLVKACQARNIELGHHPIDLRQLISAARLAEKTFMAAPNLYRPVSGLHVDWVNASIVNIPDFLGADGKRTYFLNPEGLHKDTIAKILQVAGFEDELARDPEFVKKVLDAVQLHMVQVQETAQVEYEAITSRLKEFYNRSRISPEAVKDIASMCAVDYLVDQTYI